MQPHAYDEAFEALFRTCHVTVLRFAQRRLVDDAAAWDVVSETFLTAWRRRDSQPSESDRVLPWLYAIAGNAVRNRRRTDQRAARLAAQLSASDRRVSETGDGDVVAEEALARDDALRVLGLLSPDDREVLTLVVWEGLDVAGLAAALEVSPAAAKVRLHRARRRLQDLAGAPLRAVPLARPVPSAVGRL